MTPEEKAKELVDKYYALNNGELEWATDIPIEIARQCALIAVEEIIAVCKQAGTLDYRIPYWQEVKEEIEKL